MNKVKDLIKGILLGWLWRRKLANKVLILCPKCTCSYLVSFKAMRIPTVIHCPSCGTGLVASQAPQPLTVDLENLRS